MNCEDADNAIDLRRSVNRGDRLALGEQFYNRVGRGKRLIDLGDQVWPAGDIGMGVAAAQANRTRTADIDILKEFLVMRQVEFGSGDAQKTSVLAADSTGQNQVGACSVI